MKKRRIISAAMASVMSLSLSAPALAAGGEVNVSNLTSSDNTTLTATSTEKLTDIKVELPTQIGVILNPYGLEFDVPTEVDSSGQNVISYKKSTERIISAPYAIKNLSDTDLKLAVITDVLPKYVGSSGNKVTEEEITGTVTQLDINAFKARMAFRDNPGGKMATTVTSSGGKAVTTNVGYRAYKFASSDGTTKLTDRAYAELNTATDPKVNKFEIETVDARQVFLFAEFQAVPSEVVPTDWVEVRNADNKVTSSGIYSTEHNQDVRELMFIQYDDKGAAMANGTVTIAMKPSYSLTKNFVDPNSSGTAKTIIGQKQYTNLINVPHADASWSGASTVYFKFGGLTSQPTSAKNQWTDLDGFRTNLVFSFSRVAPDLDNDPEPLVIPYEAASGSVSTLGAAAVNLSYRTQDEAKRENNPKLVASDGNGKFALTSVKGRVINSDGSKGTQMAAGTDYDIATASNFKMTNSSGVLAIGTAFPKQNGKIAKAANDDSSMIYTGFQYSSSDGKVHDSGVGLNFVYVDKLLVKHTAAAPAYPATGKNTAAKLSTTTITDAAAIAPNYKLEKVVGLPASDVKVSDSGITFDWENSEKLGELLDGKHKDKPLGVAVKISYNNTSNSRGTKWMGFFYVGSDAAYSDSVKASMSSFD